MNKLLLVDTSSVGVTLFYALGGGDFLKQETVVPAEIHTFLRRVAVETLDNIETRIKFDGYTAVRLALDPPKTCPSWRYKIYSDYKGAQSAPNKPRIAQLLQPHLAAEASARGIQSRFSPNYEADDVLATMVGLAADWQGHIDVWSLDKDLHQLVSANVHMIGKKGQKTTLEEVRTQWRVEPEAIPLVKALAGDASDNIPGIKGLGVATVSSFLRKAPYRKPTPYWINFEAVPKQFKLELTHLLPRICRDEKICTLSKRADLLPGEKYSEY
jgi:5'-3' exonuclease